MTEHSGWLFDVYTGPHGQAVVWLIDDDGQRRRFTQVFPVAFYASGSSHRLRQLWQFLSKQPAAPARASLTRVERSDLFQSGPMPVLAIEVERLDVQPRLFQKVQRAFPDLTYYDVDLPLALRYAAACGLFPMARCRLQANESGEIQSIQPLDTPWDLDPFRPPLRMLHLEPDVHPAHAAPQTLRVRFERFTYRFLLEPARPLLINLQALLRRCDPDLLLATQGDTWMLPLLMELSQRCAIPLNLNRDERMEARLRSEHSYFSYGQIVYRGRQVHLCGRWHIDAQNALLYDDFGLDGILEFARVTALPVQEAARVSPGTGISAMQIVTALRKGILVPWHKQQSEQPRPALEVFRRDQGGMIYQPTPGLHSDVAEVDFVSMYPSLMVRFNISPETAGSQPGNPTALEPFPGPPGLVPLTLQPLLEKRLALKARLGQTPAWHPRRAADQARSAAHKWLLVTCFGYLGYKNARFGRIEAHEAVTAYGREALLRAKEAAEDLGGSILHMYVDGLWIQHPAWKTPADVQALLEAIAERTGLSISLDGIYRWVVFLPARGDERITVPNRYFGVFQDGTLKVRGIEARRGDTPIWISDMQMEILECLAQAPSAADLPEYFPQAQTRLHQALANLRAGRVPLEKLLVAQKLSRALEAYRTPSPAARAATQLQAVGKIVKPGQRVRFLYMRGRPGVYAWDLPTPPDPRALDLAYYDKFMRRAANTILEPLGMKEKQLRYQVQCTLKVHCTLLP